MRFTQAELDAAESELLDYLRPSSPPIPESSPMIRKQQLRRRWNAILAGDPNPPKSPYKPYPQGLSPGLAIEMDSVLLGLDHWGLGLEIARHCDNDDLEMERIRAFVTESLNSIERLKRRVNEESLA